MANETTPIEAPEPPPEPPVGRNPGVEIARQAIADLGLADAPPEDAPPEDAPPEDAPPEDAPWEPPPVIRPDRNWDGSFPAGPAEVFGEVSAPLARVG